MEKLKSVIPETLKQKISESTPDDLLSTCSSLLHLFQNLPLFHQMVRDLTDPEMALCRKNKEAAFEAKANGNECFSKGDYPRALRFYSQTGFVLALRIAPADVEDMKKSLIATLYVNRASSLHAWFRRGKANASLENYRDAISDLNVSIKMETSLSGKRQIQSELSMIVDRSGEKINALEKPDDHISDELLQTKLQCVSTPTKGRGMTSYNDIPQGSLIHKEDPYAAIILKQFRETYCHFCFNELPEDTVPCVSCSIPLYCSVKCQVQAGGRGFSDSVNTYGYQGHLSDDIEDYIRNVISLGSCTLNSEHIAEHRHECCGMHWPAVLPSDVVLAGRILVKYIQQQNDVVDPNFHGILIIILLSQIRVNSMAIVRLKFSDARQHLDYDVTSSVEQVRVAQAVYSRGSLFNHSCQPNVHAYFVSRTLFIQATEYITAGSQLELSYGPQVGQWDCRERREILEDRYSFICQCRCCAQLNLSDLVINAYRCTAPNCFGVVLDSCVAKYENEKLKYFKGQNSMQDYMLNDDEIRKVASHVFEQTGNNIHFETGRCLSCGSYCDLQASQKVITEAGFCVKRYCQFQFIPN
ncbi:hypothetical protein ACJIZ3_009454 [Penstemon smallii]|uniref:SET domain-containing protein n=1 Tax=Penstemon smallii TaxID=265156 RepID=A0ABD3TEB1_9LAMI